MGCNGASPTTFTPGWCTGGSPESGESLTNGRGSFSSVYADGTNLFVISSHAIKKFDQATGAYLGWTGGVSTTPTSGGGTCTSQSSGMATGQWCIGGTSQSLQMIDGGFYSPNTGPWSDGTYVYVADGYKVSRFNISTGTFAGWSGKVTNTPTGGTTGCTSTTSGNMTPGWCTGGTPQFTFDSYSIAGDIANDALYVARQYFVEKYKLSTGQYIGWWGRIQNGTTFTGGDFSCLNANLTENMLTPGWCKGGTPNGSTSPFVGANDFFAIKSISSAGGHLYVTVNGGQSPYDPEKSSPRIIKIPFP